MKLLCVIFGVLMVFPVVADEFYEVEMGDRLPDHLEPVDYPPDRYDERIAKHLFLTNGELGRFICRPSFDAELCVSVHEDNGKYFITLTQASKSLYHTMNHSRDPKDRKKDKKVKVTRDDREISLELAVAIQRSWGRMLQHTKYPAKVLLGLDGTKYQFSVFVRGMGYLHGETWSPDSGLTAEIANLGCDLAAFATDKDAKEPSLIKHLKAFEAKMPKPK